MEQYKTLRQQLGAERGVGDAARRLHTLLIPSCRYGQGRGDEPGISTAGSRGSGCPALAGPATAARTDSTSMADSNDLMIILQCCCRGFLPPEPSRLGLGPAEQVSITQA